MSVNNTLLNSVTKLVRSIILSIAKAINKVSSGRVKPNFITTIGLIAHIPIAILISKGYFGYAGVGVIIFGLFDTLDGELARLQNNSSTAGMFFDSVSDRAKEILIYLGLALFFAQSGTMQSLLFNNLGYYELLPWIVAALGISLLTSYLNAWGEVAIVRSAKSGTKPNTTFRGGLAPYEVRIALLGAGLLFNEVLISLIMITLLALVTVVDRFVRITKELQ